MPFPSKEAIFSFRCRLFNSSKSAFGTAEGFSDWRKLVQPYKVGSMRQATPPNMFQSGERYGNKAEHRCLH